MMGKDADKFNLDREAPARGRADNDHYPTPPLLARAAVREVTRLFGHPHRMLEPGSAGRAPFLLAALTPDWHHGWDPVAIAVELRDVARPACVNAAHWYPDTDFLRWDVGDPLELVGPHDPRRPDLIITNPPFSLAVEFVAHAREIVHEMGVVAMLLQTGIEGAIKRRDFWARHRPILRYVIRPRPGFVKRSNDSREYAVYVWPGRRLGALLDATGRGHTETRFLDNDGPWGFAE